MFKWLGKMFKGIGRGGKAISLYFGHGVPQEIVARELAEYLRSWFTGKISVEPTAREDVRGQLLDDIRKLSKVEREVLWRRHAEASERREENRFVILLSKIPRGVRGDVFSALAKMPDDQFWQALELLHHDAVWQFLEHALLHAGPALRQAWQAAREGGRLIAAQMPQTRQAWRDGVENIESRHQERRLGFFHWLFLRIGGLRVDRQGRRTRNG